MPSQLNCVRIIGGQWRGRRITVLDRQGLRPTTDRVREQLFNWLMNEVVGARCLDLFAGSGALGLECLSRGAASVDFVESDPQIAQQLNANLVKLDAQHNSRVHVSQAQTFVATASSPYDLIFIDPPFAANLIQPILKALSHANCYSQGTLIYLESPARQAIHLPNDWQIHRQDQTKQSQYLLAFYSPDTL